MITSYLDAGARSKFTLKQLIDAAGLSANLVLCVDAGDIASYAGSGQQWSDVSGVGNHLLLGATSGVEGSDPTFKGTAGNLSENEYFLHDGGDWFSTLTKPSTFDDNWCRDAALVSYVLVAMLQTTGVQYRLAGNSSGGSFGHLIGGNTDNTIKYTHQTTNVPASSTKTSVGATTPGSINTVMVAHDENGPAIRLKAAGNAVETFVSTASTATSAPGANYALMANDGDTGNGAPPNLTRTYAFAIWDGKALSSAEMDLIYNALKTNRFPSLA